MFLGIQVGGRVNEEMIKRTTKRIVQKGGEKFLESLSVEYIYHHHNDTRKCTISGEKVGLERKSWAIVDSSGRPMFQDRFSTKEYGEQAAELLSKLLAAFKEYLGLKKNGSKLTEDDLSDPIFLGNNESFRKFKQKCIKYVEFHE